MSVRNASSPMCTYAMDGTTPIMLKDTPNSSILLNWRLNWIAGEDKKLHSLYFQQTHLLLVAHLGEKKFIWSK